MCNLANLPIPLMSTNPPIQLALVAIKDNHLNKEATIKLKVLSLAYDFLLMLDQNNWVTSIVNNFRLITINEKQRI